jgi:hypothetical protein rflaF_16865|nr:MAG TPA: tail tape measure protein [Caudoviricetes sp.]
MTIRDISVAFGFDVDTASQQQAESSIKSLKDMATKFLGTIAIAFSVKSLGSFVSDCVEAASNVEEMENKFNVVFGDMSTEMDSWATQFADSVGRNKNSIKSYLADQQNLLVGFGMTREEGANLSKEMTSLALDIASFSNQDEYVAVNAMTKAVMGESEAAKTLGAVLNDTTRAETMRALGMKGSYDKLSQLEKMQVNYNAILRQSPDAVDDCVRSMGSYESSIRSLKSSQEEFKEFIGGQLLPVMAVFVQWVTKGVKAATKFAKAILLDAEGNNRILKTFDKIHSTVKILQPAMDRFTSSMKGGIDRVIGVVGSIVNRFGGMENALKLLSIVASAFFISMNWGKIIKGAKSFLTLIQGLGKFFGASSLQVLGVIAVIVVLALIVEDFIQFMLGNDSVIGEIFKNAGIDVDEARQNIINAFEKVKEFLFNIFDTIKEAVGMFVDTVKGFFEKHGEEIYATFERYWNLVMDYLGGIFTFISQLISTIFGDSSDDIADSQESSSNTILSTWQKILNFLSMVFDRLFEIVNTSINIILTIIEIVFGLIKSFWDNWGGAVLTGFKIIFDGLKIVIDGFMQVLNGILNFLTSVFQGNWSGAWQAIKEIFSGLWDMIIGIVHAASGALYTVIVTVLGLIVTIWESIWNGITSFLSGVLAAIAAFISDTFNNILNGITSTVGNIKDAIVNGFTAAIDFIKSLPSQAVQWGIDMIQGIANGITGAMGKVTDAVKNVAGNIKSFLHFSVPDEGPLTDYESWMPDFMGGLAKGIKSSRKNVIDEIKLLTGDMSALMNLRTASYRTAANSTIGNKSTSITQNVNIDNSYTGGSIETQRNVSNAMKKSASDVTTYMARALAYSRG